MSEKIISEWFHQYSDEMYNFLIYRLGESDVEDCVQEVFIRAYKSLPLYKGESSPRTWLYTIARNIAIDELRKRKRKKWKVLVSFEAKHEPNMTKTPEEILSLNEENKQLYQAIQSLKQNYRDVIILRGLEGFSITETAEILDWSEPKTSSTYHRAKLELKDLLGGAFYEERSIGTKASSNANS
ncbi:RNA polymerase sigma factor [Sutcliffiella sp. NC1]|uniref:RNA polymerase sigma factor n=1 Tax=Sutcliffiella sp. NC1 TaxID=3004096 RepID=UPI0022DE6B83|nr:RNA polymerase sigma factor [Sutcliffiella sp. NC1]WBL16629.1 RNA polymerase sigma factor [Sutcliffiella sp. NC1]